MDTYENIKGVHFITDNARIQMAAQINMALESGYTGYKCVYLPPNITCTGDNNNISIWIK